MAKQNTLIEYKDLDIKALEERVKTAKKEVQDLLIDKNMSKLKDLRSLSKRKKEIARMLTIINQKKLIATLEQKGEIK